MTATVLTHKTNFQLSKWFDGSILTFVKFAAKKTPRQNISTNFRTSPNVFYSFLFPTHFLPPLKKRGAVWLSPIATNLFATQAEAQPKQINPLQSPTHFFGFFKPSFAITNLTQFVFAKDRQKQNQLNFPTHIIGLLRSFFARVLDAPKCAPQAYGILIVSATNCCMTPFFKKTLGFP